MFRNKCVLKSFGNIYAEICAMCYFYQNITHSFLKTFSFLIYFSHYLFYSTCYLQYRDSLNRKNNTEHDHLNKIYIPNIINVPGATFFKEGTLFQNCQLKNCNLTANVFHLQNIKQPVSG